MQISRLCFLAAAAAALTAAPALAQTDMMAMQRTMSANHLGVLEYCKTQGYTDESAVTAERTTIAALPPGSSQADMDAAEAKGKQGVISANGQDYPLSTMASKSNTTESAMCKQMADNVVKVQAMQKSMAMPAMPNGMPAMPAMPQQPAMPQ